MNALWFYVMFIDGRLIDVVSQEDINPNFPTFDGVHDAESYIEANDLRISIV